MIVRSKGQDEYGIGRLEIINLVVIDEMTCNEQHKVHDQTSTLQLCVFSAIISQCCPHCRLQVKERMDERRQTIRLDCDPLM